MDSFTERSYTSYTENLGNSFKGMVFGLVLIVGSIILLWWNEGESLKQSNALKEMQEKIITLLDTNYHEEYENQAVLIQGIIKPLHALVDSEFNVKSNGLVLRKTVQMYQWREKKTTRSEDKLGGGTQTITTYDYVKEWSSQAIHSSSFKHETEHHNPPMKYQSKTFSTHATLGEYTLSKEMVSKINTLVDFNGLSTMPDKINQARNYHAFLYIGLGSPTYPIVGDIKIIYTYAPSEVYTYASKVAHKSLVPYVTQNGKSFVFVRKGSVEADAIFAQALQSNATQTWILRAVGLLMMFFGFNMIVAPLSVLAKVIPMLGDIVGGIGGFLSAILTLILGSFVIALAWFSARPILSIGLIAGAFLISFVVGRFGKKEPLEEMEEEEVKEKISTPPTRKTPPPRR